MNETKLLLVFVICFGQTRTHHICVHTFAHAVFGLASSYCTLRNWAPIEYSKFSIWSLLNGSPFDLDALSRPTVFAYYYRLPFAAVETAVSRAEPLLIEKAYFTNRLEFVNRNICFRFRQTDETSLN